MKDPERLQMCARLKTAKSQRQPKVVSNPTVWLVDPWTTWGLGAPAPVKNPKNCGCPESLTTSMRPTREDFLLPCAIPWRARLLVWWWDGVPQAPLRWSFRQILATAELKARAPEVAMKLCYSSFHSTMIWYSFSCSFTFLLTENGAMYRL